MFDKELERWKELDPKKRAFFIVFIIIGVIFLYLNHQKNVAAESAAEKVRLEKVAAEESGKTTGPKYNFSALPQTQRNQGLEDLSLEIQKLRDELSSYRQAHGNPPAAPARDNIGAPPAYAPKAVDLNQKLPETATSQAAPAFDVDALEAKTSKGAPAEGAGDVNQPTVRPRARMRVWPASEKPAAALSKSNEPKLVIPINSALEAVMLTGINARPSGAIGSTVGSPRSAKTVGAPFVTKIKGDATLPNGWKLDDLGDCLLGGSGIAVLSEERVKTISDTISCIAPNGDVYEAPINAYGVDADGVQGLAGKVVSKQGAILAQAFITQSVSGLGAALTPTVVPGYNSSSSGGTTQYQTPDAAMVARTAVGSGISGAASQLSRFYLEFAKETFPVIEVVAATRITWILLETIELKRTKRGS